MSQVFKLHQAKSSSSGSVTPNQTIGASVNQIKPESVNLPISSQGNSQVLMEDQGDKVLKQMMGNPLSQQ